jgi:hypothetical protein
MVVDNNNDGRPEEGERRRETSSWSLRAFD